MHTNRVLCHCLPLGGAPRRAAPTITRRFEIMLRRVPRLLRPAVSGSSLHALTSATVLLPSDRSQVRAVRPISGNSRGTSCGESLTMPSCWSLAPTYQACCA